MAQPAERIDLRAVVDIDGAGAGQIRLNGPSQSRRWTISRITVSVTGGIDANPLCRARVYVGGSNDESNFIDGTIGGALDVAEYPDPIPVSAGESVFVAWTGADTSAARQARVRVQGVSRSATGAV